MSPFSRSLRLAVVLTCLLIAVFSVYVYSEKQIDRAHERRYQSFLLADELRQSSDDLTRMVRTYVLTGKPFYKQYYLDILSIRDGKKMRPSNYGNVYWNLVSGEGEPPRTHLGTQVALLAVMQQAGFSDEEFRQLAQAKTNSDQLTRIEFAAMALVESQGSPLDARRLQASAMLHDAQYHQFKAGIMQPIQTFLASVDQRTERSVHQTEHEAILLRVLFILVGLGLLGALWRSYKTLQGTLGGSVDEVHMQITRLGQGNLSDPVVVASGMADSVLGWLALTQRQLLELATARQAAEVKIKRLAALYAALSYCNQAIVRCTREQELFEQVCQAAVAHGGMKMAWIGLVNPDDHTVRPAVAQGAGVEYLEGIHITTEAHALSGQGPVGTAIRSDRPFWCQDYQNDPRTAPWHEMGARYGWAALAALPLHRNGVAIGAFNVYVDEPHAFDEQAQNLLMEMASDIDYALRNFDREAARVLDQAQRAQTQQMDALRSFMLERLTSDAPLEQVIDDFVHRMQETIAGARCTIRLSENEAPATDLTEVPHQPGADCVAIVSGSKKVLGSFSLDYPASATPAPYLRELIDMAARLSAIAIERKHAEMQLQLATKVLEQSGESLMITDSQGALVRVNHAFSQITGFSAAEVLGRNPSLLGSGRHTPDFFRAMWAAIHVEGHWQGEVWNRHKAGTLYPLWLSVSALLDSSGAVTHYVALGADISRRKQDEAHIRQLADFDALTGLPNRRLLHDQFDAALSHAQRHGQSLALMFLDLDRFKNVNDSLGHRIGDALLIQVAQRLKSVLGAQDTVCRMGGDEFALLCPAVDAAGAGLVANRVLESTLQRYQIEDQDLSISFSIGIALYPADGVSFESLSMRAESAMYRAKQGGRNVCQFFAAEMQAQSARTLQLENGLRRALELQQLHLVYQPQVSLHEGRIVGMEALLRWQHPTLGRVSPAEFIPVAEESGLILSIGEWVLRTATRQLRVWMDAGLPVNLMAVNLSAVQFRHANLPALVTQVLAEADLPPQCLELELTEGVAMGNPLGAIAIMDSLDQCGVRMSIDDFGTGYSSLSYLKRFKVYKLKIDQSFVRDITDDPDDKAIVVAVIALARSLGFLTIAEGVETAGQLAFLREQGCDEVQGYLYSPPLPAAEFEAFVRQHALQLEQDRSSR